LTLIESCLVQRSNFQRLRNDVWNKRFAILSNRVNVKALHAKFRALASFSVDIVQSSFIRSQLCFSLVIAN